MAIGKVAELGNFIRDQRRNARLSLRKLSNMAGISNPYLSQIERGMRRPSAEILQAIAKALRISAETMYVKAGILEERGEQDPIAAVLNDLAISEKQKQVLIEIYQSFRHENELEGKGVRASEKTEAIGKATKSEKKTAALSKRPPARKPVAKKTAKKKAARRRPASAKARSGR